MGWCRLLMCGGPWRAGLVQVFVDGFGSWLKLEERWTYQGLKQDCIYKDKARAALKSNQNRTVLLLNKDQT